MLFDPAFKAAGYQLKIVGPGNFHRQMLGLAAESLESASRSERSVEGYTLPIQKKDFPKVAAILKSAFEQISKLESAKDASNEIYHIALSAFPITKRDAE